MSLVRRRLKYLGLTAGGLLIAAGACGYVAVGHRFHKHVENAGWTADFNYLLLACRFCTGRVERLTYAGRPVGLLGPGAINEPSLLVTPVGEFEPIWHEGQYRASFVGVNSYSQAGEPIGPEDIERGYCDAPSNEPGRRECRPGTPAHWCMLKTPEYCRWLDPGRLDEFDWATSQPSTTWPASQERPDGNAIRTPGPEE